MTRHPNDLRASSPAVQRAREREEKRQPPHESVVLDIKVDDVDEGGLDVHQPMPQAFVTELLDDGKDPRWSGHGESRVDLHLEREASFVRVKGRAHFLLSHPCVRCLNDVPFDVDLDIDLRLVQRKQPSDVEADFAEGSGDGDDFAGAPLGDAADLEDLDVASYESDTVKLGDLMREQLFLELPMHPACDSRGARPTQPCAFDAKKTSAESQGWVDPRWAGLEKIREKLATPTDDIVALPGRKAYTASTMTKPAATAMDYAAKPGANGTKPAATSTKPAATSTKPPAPATKPAATSTKPAPKKAKAAAKKAKPVAKKAKPAAKKAKPAAKKAKPAAKKAKPAAKKPAAKKAAKKAKPAAKKSKKRGR